MAATLLSVSNTITDAYQNTPLQKSYVVGFYNKVFAFVCLLIMSNY